MAEKYPNVSSYVYCDNNPIRIIDPDGKDKVYLNSNLQVKNVSLDGSNNISIIESNGTQKPLNNYNISFSLFDWNYDNRQIVANVAGYYGKQIGVSGIGATSAEGGMANFNPSDYFIWITANNKGFVSSQFGNKYNLENAIYHEFLHKQNKINGIIENYSTHAQVVIGACNHNSFKKATSNYKLGAIGYLSQMIMNSYYQENKDKVNDLITQFNNLGTGYSLQFDSENKRMNVLKNNNKYAHIDYEKSNNSPNLK